MSKTLLALTAAFALALICSPVSAEQHKDATATTHADEKKADDHKKECDKKDCDHKNCDMGHKNGDMKKEGDKNGDMKKEGAAH